MTYTQTVYSTRIHLWTTIVGILIGMIGFVLTIMLFDSYIICFSTLAVFIILSKLLALKFYKALVEFTLTENGLELKWIKQFSVYKYPNYSFAFDNLKEYTIESLEELTQLKLSTKDGKQIRLEFKSMEFLNDLQKSITNYNNKDNNITNDIQSGRTFLEGTTAKIFAGVLILGLIAAWFKETTNQNVNHRDQTFRLVMVTIGVVFYTGLIVYSSFNRKKK